MSKRFPSIILLTILVHVFIIPGLDGQIRSRRASEAQEIPFIEHHRNDGELYRVNLDPDYSYEDRSNLGLHFEEAQLSDQCYGTVDLSFFTSAVPIVLEGRSIDILWSYKFTYDVSVSKKEMTFTEDWYYGDDRPSRNGGTFEETLLDLEENILNPFLFNAPQSHGVAIDTAKAMNLTASTSSGPAYLTRVLMGWSEIEGSYLGGCFPLYRGLQTLRKGEIPQPSREGDMSKLKEFVSQGYEEPVYDLETGFLVGDRSEEGLRILREELDGLEDFHHSNVGKTELGDSIQGLESGLNSWESELWGSLIQGLKDYIGKNIQFH